MIGTTVKKILRDIVVFLLAACLGLVPIAALHSCASIKTADAAPAAHPLNNDSSDKASLSSYYLTNDRFVTPVKLQNPWGACWAFAIASAIESSILKAEAKLSGEYPTPDTSTYPKLTGLNGSVDLSERAIAWFAHEPQNAESTTAGHESASSNDGSGNTPAPTNPAATTTSGTASGDESASLNADSIARTNHSQEGEGYVRTDANDYLTQLAGGNFKIVEAMLTARQGLILEETAPYQYNGYTPGAQPWYSMDTQNGDARQLDWSVEGAIRTTDEVGWRVSEVIRLTSPAVVSYSPYTGISQYEGYDANATKAIKQTLVDVGAVAIAIEAEMNIPENVAAASPEPTESSDHFDYNTWSQYNAEGTVVADHAVAIVGWDDSYSAANFSGAISGMPPGNGAWLCKNNWGSDAYYEALGHPEDALHWGIRDESGAASGFFWLSYYDHSIINPTAFEVQPIEDDYENLYQYDYLGSSEYLAPSTYETTVRVANVFTAESTELLKAITAQTFQPGETVNVQIYTLPPVEAHSAKHNSKDNSDATPQDQPNNNLASGSTTQGNSGYAAENGADTAADSTAEEQRELAELEKSAKPLIYSQVEDIQKDTASADESSNNFLAGGHLVQSFSETFDTAGFHVIDLENPVLVAKGERFAIVQNIAVGEPDNETGAEESYLSVEIAFTDIPKYYEAETLPNVVSNEGETYVALFEGDDQWMTTEELNQWYADVQAEAGHSADLVIGNALIKALTDGTTMNGTDRIYELVKLY